MAGYELLIKNGTVIFPDRGVAEKKNIAVRNGKTAEITVALPEAESVIDAEGLFVSPGFIDTHLHDEEICDGKTIEQSMLRQGVTTAIAGNCGCGPLAEEILPHRTSPWINLGYLTGHTKLREAAGCIDSYAAATEEQLAKMCRLLDRELQNGSFGLSIGLEYLPNTPASELEALFKTAEPFADIWVPIHIRSDGPAAVASTDEVLDYAKNWKLRFQISHTGSMTAFGHLAEVLEHIDAARAEGRDVTFDCYPYDAFCTHLGSAVFDPGFAERWGKGTEALEIGSGPLRGRWLNEDGLYERLRREAPETLIIAHVIHRDEMELCICHPQCAVASDALLFRGHGHPRAAGTFPRALCLLRSRGYTWPDALRKCTSLPAEMAKLPGKGHIEEGYDADFVIFDPGTLKDNATFAHELLPPTGIKWVVIGGRAALKDNEILGCPKGKLIFRNK